MRRATASRLTAILLTLGLVTACGNDDPATTPTADETSASSGEGTDVAVSGAFGEAPVVELPTGSPDGGFAVEVLEPGDGAEIADGGLIVTNYVAYLWPADEADRPEQDEPLFDTFASGSPEAFTLAEERTIPGMVDGLVGTTVGSRVLLVLPPDTAFGEAGHPDIGVGPEDTLVFVFDVLDTFAADQAADGTPVEPDPSFPAVTEGDTGPTATIPAATAPTELRSVVLIQGDGPQVTSGQLLVVQYRGQLWKDGSEFDASWTSGAPASFPIGVGGVISGWDKTLVGQTVGSRVLLVIPPADGYGEAGNPPSIAGDDTLVFVVDILGAYGGS